MKPPQRVVWSEGMLVSPQHLQQQDLYHERLLDERIAALAPYRWGVVTAEIDAGALGTDQLRVTKFVGILPDGLYLGFEGGDPECPPARPIGAHFPPTQASCDVYLAVPKEREGVPSVSAELPGTPASTRAARARFRAVSRSVADLTGNAADLSMAFAHRNAVVLFGGESREDFDAIKISEVVRDGRGALIVNETYIPPTPRIDTSPFLMGGVRRLLALLVTKQRQLAGDRRQRDGASIEFNAGDITRFLQLSTVNTAIPLLTYAASNGEINPNQLYLLLAQVAGQLATFGSDVDPSKLPLFQYTDLRATFEELFARVTGLLRTTVREAFMTVSMDVVDGIHLGKLDDDRLLTATQYVLAVRSEIPEAQLAQRLPGLCKIAARSQLPQVIRAAASPGVPIAVTHRPPAEIPVKAGVTYFGLTLQNEFWRQIVEERLVAIYLPPPFGPQHVKLELLA
ncbi:MAG TPA: type VI secretion system baseplate subunit TssK, partial [Polyangia bacterium]|nr:type VI secretion system baseplate subunit TssK [Polyangia bacterium]